MVKTMKWEIANTIEDFNIIVLLLNMNLAMTERDKSTNKPPRIEGYIFVHT